MWAPFNFLFIFLLFFEQRFPHFSMEGFWKDLQQWWLSQFYGKCPKKGKNKVFSIENACISTNIRSQLRTVINFGLIFIILSKLKGKQLCKKFVFMKNKCGTINDHSNIWNWNRHMSIFALFNMSCLLDSVVLWRHLVAIIRHGDIWLTFVEDNRPICLLYTSPSPRD